MDKKQKAALASYGRAFIVAVAAAIGLGKTDPTDLLIAGVVAVIGPGLRAINPKDPAFGIIADEISKLLKKKK